MREERGFSLGVNNVTLGPTLPACLSPKVLKVLVEKFNIKPHTTVKEDMKVLLNQA
jgi:hydroxylamine reductase